jgi:farnesyl-diphosphate farnesyltransferase
MPRARSLATTSVQADRAAARAWCRAMLPRVSRTFALNIRLLPGELGEAVLLAYLFCRIADTVEDSPYLEARDRPALLAAYRNLFPLDEGWEAAAGDWSRAFEGLEAHGPDHALCRGAVAVFASFAQLPSHLRPPVEACVREMAEGMRSFAVRRAAAPDGGLRLETLAELEEYCHYVAGTVGQMLLRLFAASTPHLDRVRLERMQRLAGRFGLAMQLTNIIKDVAEDAGRGAFFVPRALTVRHRLAPEEMLDPQRRSAALAVVRELVGLAAGALDAALAFTLLIPRRETRLRLFCLWPIFLAVSTLRVVLEDERLLLPGARLRIGRAEVRRCLGRTTLAVWSNRAIQRLYARQRLALDVPAAGS